MSEVPLYPEVEEVSRATCPSKLAIAYHKTRTFLKVPPGLPLSGFDRLRVGWLLGGVPREQKMLKGHLPRVIYHRVYSNIRRKKAVGHDPHISERP